LSWLLQRVGFSPRLPRAGGCSRHRARRAQTHRLRRAKPAPNRGARATGESESHCRRWWPGRSRLWSGTNSITSPRHGAWLVSAGCSVSVLYRGGSPGREVTGSAAFAFCRHLSLRHGYVFCSRPIGRNTRIFRGTCAGSLHVKQCDLCGRSGPHRLRLSFWVFRQACELTAQALAVGTGRTCVPLSDKTVTWLGQNEQGEVSPVCVVLLIAARRPRHGRRTSWRRARAHYEWRSEAGEHAPGTCSSSREANHLSSLRTHPSRYPGLRQRAMDAHNANTARAR
jgi:hypothetical protein